jgi:hypothetical protein
LKNGKLLPENEVTGGVLPTAFNAFVLNATGWQDVGFATMGAAVGAVYNRCLVVSVIFTIILFFFDVFVRHDIPPFPLLIIREK